MCDVIRRRFDRGTVCRRKQSPAWLLRLQRRSHKSQVTESRKAESHGVELCFYHRKKKKHTRDSQPRKERGLVWPQRPSAVLGQRALPVVLGLVAGQLAPRGRVSERAACSGPGHWGSRDRRRGGPRWPLQGHGRRVNFLPPARPPEGPPTSSSATACLGDAPSMHRPWGPLKMPI